MKFGSLFTGIGGLDLGLERAGMECVFQVERAKYATRVLERYWPGVRRWKDIADFIADANQFSQKQFHGKRKQQLQKIQRNGWLEISLLCGGFPCQPVSVAGNRRGDGDERWLWPQFNECIRILRPNWVLIENVPGLLSAANGRLFRGILGDLWQGGYDAEWTTLPAAAFGAPHLRERVFIVAYSNRASPARQQRNSRQILSNRKTTRVEQVSGEWRSVKPTICRGDHGFSNRVDRLRCLGNAVVPQVAEWIGKQIMEFHKEQA